MNPQWHLLHIKYLSLFPVWYQNQFVRCSSKRNAHANARVSTVSQPLTAMHSVARSSSFWQFLFDPGMLTTHTTQQEDSQSSKELILYTSSTLFRTKLRGKRFFPARTLYSPHCLVLARALLKLDSQDLGPLLLVRLSERCGRIAKLYNKNSKILHQQPSTSIQAQGLADLY